MNHDPKTSIVTFWINAGRQAGRTLGQINTYAEGAFEMETDHHGELSGHYNALPEAFRDIAYEAYVKGFYEVVDADSGFPTS